jgi:hypothetical protein
MRGMIGAPGISASAFAPALLSLASLRAQQARPTTHDKARDRPMMKVFIGSALLLVCATHLAIGALSEETPAEFANRFYHAYGTLRVRGIPNEKQRHALSPFLSPELLALYAQADQWAQYDRQPEAAPAPGWGLRRRHFYFQFGRVRRNVRDRLPAIRHRKNDPPHSSHRPGYWRCLGG